MIYPQAERHFRVQQAVRRSRALSREGLLERVFERLFHGLVYAQIWEDPEVDLEALALRVWRAHRRLREVGEGGGTIPAR